MPIYIFGTCKFTVSNTLYGLGPDEGKPVEYQIPVYNKLYSFAIFIFVLILFLIKPNRRLQSLWILLALIVGACISVILKNLSIGYYSMYFYESGKILLISIMIFTLSLNLLKDCKSGWKKFIITTIFMLIPVILTFLQYMDNFAPRTFWGEQLYNNSTATIVFLLSAHLTMRYAARKFTIWKFFLLNIVFLFIFTIILTIIFTIFLYIGNKYSSSPFIFDFLWALYTFYYFIFFGLTILLISFPHYILILSEKSFKEAFFLYFNKISRNNLEDKTSLLNNNDKIDNVSIEKIEESEVNSELDNNKEVE